MRIMFAQVLLFLSYFSSTSQSKKFIHAPDWLKNNQKNETAAKLQHLPENGSEKKCNPITKLTLNDLKTLMQIWATMFVFTFPILVVPYKSYD